MLSGQNSAIIAAEQYLLDHDRQVEVVPLIGGVPYHSPLLKPCGQQLRKALDRCEWRRPCCPVISNVNAQPYPDTVTPVQWLEQQLSQPVQWQRSLTYLTGHLSPIAIEIGPQSVLKNLLLENRYPAPVYAFDNRHDRAQLALVLGDNMAVKTDPEAVRRQRITLLTNALTATRHHRAADVAASAQLKELLSRFFERIQQIEQRGTSSEEDIAFLHELLEQGFQLKGSSQAEIDAWPRAVGFRQRRTGVTRHAILRTYLALKARVMEQQGIMRQLPTDDQTIVDYLYRIAGEYGEKAAVLMGDAALSYHDLNARSNQLAHYLRGLGIGEDRVVAIHAARHGNADCHFRYCKSWWCLFTAGVQCTAQPH